MERCAFCRKNLSVGTLNGQECCFDCAAEIAAQGYEEGKIISITEDGETRILTKGGLVPIKYSYIGEGS